MMVEMRTYTLVPGGGAEYLRLYNPSARALQTRILGNLAGLYQSETGELNQLVFLWAYESLDERASRRAVLAADAEFAAFRKSVRHLLVRQESRILAQA
ncbi:MAG: NIPSNAP family containing protein [Bordetella sp. SCN 67-23]|uniref:NIPSNAP family protein n=1 Tax=Pigmentiphaga sp. H8 TaxID=2488560 RepID=UPI00086C4C79|nr:NIPSNAP family protein [Pigmentiphaga sp. H8]MBN9473937.1 NIPSNAP family protein [Burkholderiales bacterium]ODS69989.1 MAG: NIPSNAP family containing protein [Bordetella sp. SCN 67-23]ODU92054.1 MAG: NIPSNAP family containing protein [Bordetella sp. SCN 68-11]OJW85999.1 MAG: NIPSNAP family protein [Burkholderiales bacterium 67-32]AZG10655.1 NIPSNAP family protein [Pigmentiphaga sp. H8]